MTFLKLTAHEIETLAYGNEVPAAVELIRSYLREPEMTVSKLCELTPLGEADAECILGLRDVDDWDEVPEHLDIDANCELDDVAEAAFVDLLRRACEKQIKPTKPSAYPRGDDLESEDSYNRACGDKFDWGSGARYWKNRD